MLDLGEPPGTGHRIRVEPGEQVAGCRVEAGCGRRPDAAQRLGDEPGAASQRDLCGGIGRAVVDDDDLVGRASLRGERAEAGGEIARIVDSSGPRPKW